jgi:hypothetical protein
MYAFCGSRWAGLAFLSIMISPSVMRKPILPSQALNHLHVSQASGKVEIGAAYHLARAKADGSKTGSLATVTDKCFPEATLGGRQGCTPTLHACSRTYMQDRPQADRGTAYLPLPSPPCFPPRT